MEHDKQCRVAVGTQGVQHTVLAQQHAQLLRALKKVPDQLSARGWLQAQERHIGVQPIA